MDNAQATRRMLLGIEITVLGGVLVLVASGTAVALGLIVAGAGFVVALSGYSAADRW